MELLTPEAAKELCIRAHEGQWRKPTLVTEFLGLPAGVCTRLQQSKDKEYITEEGNRITCGRYLDFYYAQPYHTHPIAVADMMTTDEGKILGYLHDVFEDCKGWKHVEVNTCGEGIEYDHFIISPEGNRYKTTLWIIIGLLHLTKKPGQSYDEYINGICKSSYPDVKKAKLTDIFHNMSCNPGEIAKAKYLKAIPKLLASL